MKTLKIMREEQISNVIWDIREVHLVYSLGGSHLIVKKINDFGFLLFDNIAVVYKQNEEQHKHADNVASNRNKNIKYFKDNIEQARNLLLQFNR